VSHPPIDAVRGLGREHGLGANDIERIQLVVHPLVAELTGKTAPRTGLEGKFSVQFACAIALIDGAARERQFSDTNVYRDDVRRLMARIELVPSGDVPHEAATAVATTIDGRRLEIVVTAATGTPDNPIADDELIEKFHDLADPIIGAEQAGALADQVWRLEEAADLTALLSATGPAEG
jgi:2-methylcitrate dehydratase PrpD